MANPTTRLVLLLTVLILIDLSGYILSTRLQFAAGVAAKEIVRSHDLDSSHIASLRVQIQNKYHNLFMCINVTILVLQSLLLYYYFSYNYMKRALLRGHVI
jgi:hypothetical protein